MKSPFRHLGLLVCCITVGGLLRVWTINHNSLWFDEVFSRNVAVVGDIPTIAINGVAGDVHPPLYFMLLDAWVRITGDSVVALRWLSALLIMLAMPAVYHLGRLLFNEQAGLFALALCVLSPFQIYYAQEARQYALSVMMAAWMLVGLAALLRGKRYGATLYILGAVGGLYTHYFVGLLLASAHFGLLLHAPYRRLWRRWLRADLLIAVLFVPQMFQFLHQSQAVLSGFWIDKPNPAQPITTLTFLLFATTLPGGILEVSGITVTIIALVIAGVDVLRRAPLRLRPNWWWGIGMLLLPLLMALVISLVGRSSLYLDKSFGLLSPVLLVVIGAGWAYARPPSIMPLIGAVLAVLMLVGMASHALTPDIRKPPFKEIAADLAARPAAPLYILHDSAFLPITYYAPQLAPKLPDLQNRSWLFPETWRIFGVQRIPRPVFAQELITAPGQFRVVITGNTEPVEAEAFKQLLSRDCAHTTTDYPSAVLVYEFTCPNAVTVQR